MLREHEIIDKICQATDLSPDDVTEKIDSKELELSGMVSRVGAAYIIGKELGVDLVKPVNKDLKISSIVPNMQKVNFFAKIRGISDIREFDTDNGKGKVLNLMLADETSSIRLSLWNEKTEVVDHIAVGDVLEVIGGYTRKDYRGSTEVRLGNFGNLRKVHDMDIDAVDVEVKSEVSYTPARLDSLSDEEFVRIKAYLVRIYEKKTINSICPVCKSRLEGTSCPSHGPVNPEKFLVISGVVDDGYGNVNAVFFRDAAEFVLKKSVEDIEKEIDAKGEKSFFESLDVCGDYLNIKGVARKNKLTGDLEIICHDVRSVDTIGEINSVLSGIASSSEGSDI